MKRILSLFVPVMLLLSTLTACSANDKEKAVESDSDVLENDNTESNIESGTENDNDIFEDNVEIVPDISIYQTETFSMQEIEGVFKPLGRVALLGTSLTCDFPASGAEFCVDCIGDVSINFTASNDDQKLSIYVDGSFAQEIALNVGSFDYTVASNLTKGEHTIRIVAQYGYTPSKLNSITLTGGLLQSEDKDIYIEFIGASSFGGYGLSPTNDYDATKSLSYTAIELLDADYSLFAQGGMGIAYSSTSGHTVNNRYPYQSNSRDKTPYSPTRTPDLIIINLGQNDNYQWYTQAQNNPNHEIFNYETFDAEVDKLIKTLDALYGEMKVPIIIVNGVISVESRTIATKRLEHLIDTVYLPAGYEIFVCNVTTNRDGYNSHSSPAGAKKQGEELAEFVKANCPWLFE